MPMFSVAAHFDGAHIKLDEDVPLTKNSRLNVTVIEESDQEREEFLRFASTKLRTPMKVTTWNIRRRTVSTNEVGKRYSYQHRTRRGVLSVERGVNNTVRQRNMAIDLDQVQAQLNGKVHWDASEAEIRDWLSEKFSIDGTQAESMIAVGLRVKAASIRKRSLLHLVLALIAAVILGGLTWLASETATGFRAREGILLTATLGALAYAGKNALRLITGRSDAAIDA